MFLASASAHPFALEVHLGFDLYPLGLENNDLISIATIHEYGVVMLLVQFFRGHRIPRSTIFLELLGWLSVRCMEVALLPNFNRCFNHTASMRICGDCLCSCSLRS